MCTSVFGRTGSVGVTDTGAGADVGAAGVVLGSPVLPLPETTPPVLVVVAVRPVLPAVQAVRTDAATASRPITTRDGRGGDVSTIFTLGEPGGSPGSS
jgi:hypothetical protein